MYTMHYNNVHTHAHTHAHTPYKYALTLKL